MEFVEPFRDRKMIAPPAQGIEHRTSNPVVVRLAKRRKHRLALEFLRNKNLPNSFLRNESESCRGCHKYTFIAVIHLPNWQVFLLPLTFQLYFYFVLHNKFLSIPRLINYRAGVAGFLE